MRNLALKKAFLETFTMPGFVKYHTKHSSASGLTFKSVKSLTKDSIVL